MLKIFKDNKFKINYKIGDKNWFGSGGNCFCFINVNSKTLLSFLVNYVNKIFPIFIIGNGSNLIIRDGGINGIVIKLGKEFSNIKFNKKDSLLYVGSSAKDTEISNFCLKNRIKGFEFLFEADYRRQQGDSYVDQHHFLRYLADRWVVKVEYLQDLIIKKISY